MLVDQGLGVYILKTYIRTSVFFAGRFEPVLTSREECNVFQTFFLEFIYVFREILSTSMFFCCSIYIETAQNSREECNEFADLLFFRLSLCLSRDSSSCDTRSLDLCISFKFIFLYLWYILPHSRAFHTFYFTPIFFLCILPREIFFLSLKTPHLNKFFLSNVYSFDTMEFSVKHKC